MCRVRVGHDEHPDGNMETPPTPFARGPAEGAMHTPPHRLNEGRDGAPVTSRTADPGPNITPGSEQAEDSQAFTDGWLHTGDAARQDEEGFVYIVDRWKDMYISGGENVYPAEVENVLFQIPGVADAAIIGVPNERWGEVGLAVIVRKPGEPLEEGDVIRHCLGNLAKFKVPQSVAFVDTLPRNATGKVLKRELRVQFVGADKPRHLDSRLAAAASRPDFLLEL